MTIEAADPWTVAAELWDAGSNVLPWEKTARPDQLAPEGDWDVWLILAGRGWGKTKTMMERAARQGRRFPGARIALVATTVADGRDVLIEGESGLLSCLQPSELRYGTVDGAWNRSLGELFLANGTKYKCYSSEKPRQLRGPQHHFTYADEIAQWNDAKFGALRDTTWANIMIGTRNKARPGWPDDYRPEIIAATTPKQVALLRSRDPQNPGLLETELVTITHGKTTDNLANLAETYQRQVVEPLLGTRLGQQELDGVLLEDVEGALFTSEQIEQDRIRFGDVPALAETVVAVDPSTTGGESSDECGIIAGGRGVDGHGYTLADDSLRGSPLVWAAQAWRTAFDVEAEALVVEDNQGGEMCEVTLLAAWPTVAPMYAQAGRIRPAIRRIHAVASKRARAVPIALMAERHQIHHVLDVGSGANSLLLLEGELTGWDGTGDSPNRLDAFVHLWRWCYRIGVKSERVVVGQRWAGGRQ